MTEKERKKTYYIRSDYYTSEYINKQFNKATWQPVNDADRDYYVKNKIPVDYIYLDGKHYYNPANYKLKANLKNIVDDSKKSITSKNNLMANLAKIPAAAKFIMPQIELDLHTINKNGSVQQKEIAQISALFEGINKKSLQPVYIFKPVTGFSGQGIRIVTTMQELLRYISQIIKENSNNWRSTVPEKALYEKQRIWVLQEYLTDPLLITQKVPHTNQSADYKFHIRHYLFYVPGQTSYYVYEGEIAPARAPYMNGNWGNKLIHDTHFYGRDGELFPSALELTEKQTHNIYEQISELYSYILACINAKCYAEARMCYELFGIDLILTRDYKLKVIEVNEKLGMPSNLTPMSKILFEGCLNKIVMPLLGLTPNKYNVEKYSKHFIPVNSKKKFGKQQQTHVMKNITQIKTRKQRKTTTK